MDTNVTITPAKDLEIEIEYILDKNYFDTEHKFHSFPTRKYEIKEINNTIQPLLTEDELVQFIERTLSKQFQELQKLNEAKECTPVKNLPVSLDSITFIRKVIVFLEVF